MVHVVCVFSVLALSWCHASSFQLTYICFHLCHHHGRHHNHSPLQTHAADVRGGRTGLGPQDRLLFDISYSFHVIPSDYSHVTLIVTNYSCVHKCLRLVGIRIIQHTLRRDYKLPTDALHDCYNLQSDVRAGDSDNSSHPHHDPQRFTLHLSIIIIIINVRCM